MQGQLLGNRYRIRELIGEGGMASVYIATDEKLDRQVAVKVLHPHLSQNEDIRERFQMEARAISGVEHPNIIKIYDYSGSHSDRLWIVVEILRGKNLAQYAKQYPGCQLHAIHAALIVREVTKALEKAHSSGIIHRDIKPENIMMLESGRVKLMDFGIAKNLHRSNATMTGTFMGSPSYMSPEQIRGKDIDQRSDIYSLGVLFYEIVSGVLPFTGGSTADVINKIMVGKFSEVMQIAPGTPTELNDIIARMMRYHQGDRYSDATEVGAVLDVFLHRFGFAESHVELERRVQDPERFRRRIDASGIEEVRRTSVIDREKSAEAISRLTTRERRGKESPPSEPEFSASSFSQVEGTRIARLDQPAKNSSITAQNSKLQSNREHTPHNKHDSHSERTVILSDTSKTTVERQASSAKHRYSKIPVARKDNAVAHEKNQELQKLESPPARRLMPQVQQAPLPRLLAPIMQKKPRNIAIAKRPVIKRQTFHIQPNWRWYAIALLALQAIVLIWGFQSVLQNWQEPPEKKSPSAAVKSQKPKSRPQKIRSFESETVIRKEPSIAKEAKKTIESAPIKNPVSSPKSLQPASPAVKNATISRAPVQNSPAVQATEKKRPPTHSKAVNSNQTAADKRPIAVFTPAPIQAEPPVPSQPSGAASLPKTLIPKEDPVENDPVDKQALETPSKPQVQTPGFIRFSVEPAAEIYVNGAKKGTTNDTSLQDGIRLNPGVYVVELRRAGYTPSKHNVTVESNGRHTVQSRLSKENPQLRKVKFTIRSSKAPFEVVVDNIKEQSSETTSSKQKRLVLTLAPGIYRVTVQAEGSTIHRTVTLVPEQESITFDAEFKAGD